MHKIYNKHGKQVESERSKSARKCVLQPISASKSVAWITIRLTDVGTSECSCKRVFTARLLMAKFFRYMISRAVSTLRLLASSSTRARLSRCCMSRFMPMFRTRDFGMRHRGHRQLPLSRTVARSTLFCNKTSCKGLNCQIGHILFWIIRGISEDPRIKSSHDPITTLDYDAMFIGFYEFIIQEYCPLCMHDFTAAMSYYGFYGPLASHIFSGKVFKCIWKLQRR